MPIEQPLALVSSNLLFRYRIPIRPMKSSWSAENGSLDDRYQLPMFGTMEGQPQFSSVAAAWSPEGLAFDVTVRDKRLPLKCQATRLVESDGVQIWIDTRNMQSVHRASRFCHWFVYLPTGGGSNHAQPWGTMVKINRAKEDAKSFQMFKSHATCKMNADGYRLSFFIPAAALTGWNVDEHKRIGFNYAIVDNELGWQTLAADFRLPIAENPSLWHTLELIDD